MATSKKKFAAPSSSKILSVTRVRHYAVKFMNPDGKESMAMVVVFGKDKRDDRPGVWIIAMEDRLNEQLRGNDTIREGVLAYLAKSEKVDASAVPEDIGGDEGGEIDLKGLGGLEL